MTRTSTSAGRTAALAGVLAGSTLALCYGLAAALSRAGVFEYVDVLFDTDAAWFLQGFSEGRGTGTGWGARSVVHPNVANLVNPPIRAVAAACASIGACAEASLTRPALAVLVSPAAAAVEAVFVFLTIRTLSGSDGRALVVAMLNLALLPTLIFGALPESFALSGCGFAALFYLASRTAMNLRVHPGWWVLVGTALASVTLTNIWLFAVAYAVTHTTGRWLSRTALLSAVRAGVFALSITAILAVVIGAAYGALAEYRTALQQFREIRAPRDHLAERRWPAAVLETAELAVTGAFISFPKALGNTVLPPRPIVQGHALGLDTTRGTMGARAEPSLQVRFQDASADWGTLIALIALAGAAVIAMSSQGPQSLVYRLALVLIAANWAFHSIFGIELFLYAKHWSVAVTMLLAAWLDLKRPVPAAGVLVLVLLTVLAAWRDVRVFTQVFQALS